MPVLEGRVSVVTLTPAPAIDHAYWSPGFETGRVNRVSLIETHIGGNGVNVASALHAAGAKARAVVPMALLDSEPRRLARSAGDWLRPVAVTAPMRVNSVILDVGGRTTNINQAAPALSTAEWKDLVDETLDASTDVSATWLLIGGALPRIAGTNESVDLDDLFERATRRGISIAIDMSGEDLIRWIRDPRVRLAKPNLYELGQLTSRELTSRREIAFAAQEIVAAGPEILLVSLGTGGLLAARTDSVTWHPAEQVADVVNTTGAGDAALAGFLFGLGRRARTQDPAAVRTALREATRWGARAVTTVASGHAGHLPRPIGHSKTATVSVG